MNDHGAATLDDIRQAGVEVLVRALGPVSMIRFLQQFETGRGDYTAERQRQDEPATPGAVAVLGEALRREQDVGHLGSVGANTRVLRPERA
ncbi:hypothetical protein tb265_50170 [Gemmatimonadetes bacterium T265]|nr:hypothetical protein tb265_50170 [Gemmatimonadetes bacterium T265]